MGGFELSHAHIRLERNRWYWVLQLVDIQNSFAFETRPYMAIGHALS